ncbi:hypothetical protein SPRG_06435 [Saprolegnia parasitica CBS 223.65]|uniref:Uncharacterized protein n=1 Tax=Saprolegnia parasitica (strain CBS 223.65) TaxID=695850 RepID=A0A067CCU1_SAPPC|nr:hypothetical protein SPRG_06435 [Saprolegnia parasitica CBS 223.65]KDO28579.1 hypothetical protein SPRG_06435 [Saprolegnia parasitica CBS 223.65]|eukprot:XP_012200642.1 hypothetical protein SPRG_06435 [Saprolegnia parasitica CBS 223.65]
MPFTGVILGQPEITTIVFGYQAGLYEDMRDTFAVCEELVAFNGCEYETDASLYRTFGAKRPSFVERSQAQLPLHLAVAGGCMYLAKRMLHCRPDLASEDAILVAFGKSQFEMVIVLLDLRGGTVPELWKIVQYTLPEFAHMWRFPVGLLATFFARQDAKGLIARSLADAT